MKNIILCFALLCMCTLMSIAAGDGSNEFDFDEYVPFEGERNDSFDWSLVKLALLKPDSNVIISPLSVKYLLVLLWEAASLNSNTELSAILQSGSLYDQRATFGQIINSLKQTSDSYELKFGTRIFIDEFIELRQRFAAIAETYYRTLIERLDFSDEISAVYINQWCSQPQATNGNVRTLVETNDLNNSVMVMLNAIYFKGLWRQPFPRHQTTVLPFYLSSTQQIHSKFIVQTSQYYYLDSPKLNAKIIRIPYKGKKFSMIIALPNLNNDLGEFIRQWDSTTWRDVETLMESDEIRVVLPKFKFESATNINELVKVLGINEIFTSRASLILLSSKEGLFVSNITQKASIQVDEGSSTNIVTEVVLNYFVSSIKLFIADRPFLFFIQDETTGILLFGGKVTNPNEF